MHHCIDATIPATAPDTAGDATGEAQDESVVRDLASGAGYALSYSSSSNAFNGIHAQQVWPTSTPSLTAPLSSVAFGGMPTSVDPGQNVAAAGRLGGGV